MALGEWVLRRCERLFAVAFVLCLSSGCASSPAFLSMGAEELWDEGVTAYNQEEWGAAIPVLERLVAQNPGHPRSPEARMYIARAYTARAEYVTAASEFERFLQLHRNHGLAPEASLGVCESYAALAPDAQRDQEYTRRAGDVCGETWLEFQGLTVAQAADSIRSVMEDRLAERAFQEAQFYERFVPVSAPAYFELVVLEHGDTNWAPQALLAIYRLYVSFGWEPEAEETSARLLAEYPDSGPAQELRAELGDVAEPAAGVDQ
jgi:outer membrane protein assembly factor BamD